LTLAFLAFILGPTVLQNIINSPPRSEIQVQSPAYFSHPNSKPSARDDQDFSVSEKRSQAHEQRQRSIRPR
jgi:hypothetical protein